MKKIIIISILVAVLIVGGVVFVLYQNKPDIITEAIPSPQPYQSPAVSPLPSSPKPPTTTPAPFEVNLAVPFTSQAPTKNWGLPYAEFCEEASVLMTASYINGWSIPSIEFAEQKMLEIKAFEEQRFGYYKDTTAEETAVILREFYKIEKVKVVYEPTAQDIKSALSDNKVVIAPAAGRILGNPYFQSPGPIYHMIVIKGYTKEGNFITNDPGTRRGANFIYTPDILMNAIHDWNKGDVDNGRKVVLVVG